MSDLLKDILDRIHAPEEPAKPAEEKKPEDHKETSRMHYSDDFWKRYGK